MRVGSVLPAARLRLMREESGLSQKDFAEQTLGIKDKSKYNKWENGSSQPNYEELSKIASKLEVTIDYLLGYSDSRTVENADVCDIYGLSEPAARQLRKWRSKMLSPFSDENPDLLRRRLATVNALLEDGQIIDLLQTYLFDPITIKKKKYVYMKACASNAPDNWECFKEPVDEKWQLEADVWSSAILFGVIRDKLQRMQQKLTKREKEA